MAVRTEFRNVATSIHREMARQFGVTITLSQRGANAISLLAIPRGEDGQPVTTRGVLDQNRRMSFEIATGQTGFAAPTTDAEPVTAGDIVTYLSRAYSVESFQKDSLHAIYVLNCVIGKRLSTGVGA